jgi:hypothetical protein
VGAQWLWIGALVTRQTFGDTLGSVVLASHKTLNGVVRSVAESFVSLMNYWDDDYVMGHVVRAAWATGATDLKADLLTGHVEPTGLATGNVLHSIAGYVDRLPSLVHSSNSDMAFVCSASLELTVDPTRRRPQPGTPFFESPFTCTVSIVDERGRTYSYTVSDWWYPERPPE